MAHQHILGARAGAHNTADMQMLINGYGKDRFRWAGGFLKPSLFFCLTAVACV